jgi:hypothetical protein
LAGSASSSPTIRKLCRRPLSRRIVTARPNCTANLRVSATGAPIAKISSRPRQRLAVAGRLGFAVLSARGLQRRLDQPQPMLGNQIGMLGDSPIRHLFDEPILIYERSAHVQDMVVCDRAVIGPGKFLDRMFA